MKAKRKQRNSAGFSLAETLMAVLILLMVSAVVAAGMPMAREAYEKAVDSANAQTLLSTTVAMLRGELSEARYISGDGTDELEFRNTRTGVETKLGVGAEDILITQLGVTRPLVTRQAATKRLSTSIDTFRYDPDTGIFTVEGLRVTRGGKTVASLSALEIMSVNP